MSQELMASFEQFLTESLNDGHYVRELRLSDEELNIIKKLYPFARLRILTTKKANDGKMWYEINILPPFSQTNQQEIDYERVKKENQQLKRELERLRKLVK
ncbi:hypothetical protein [Bacillus kwashiorkori]|uniref:hypothetical protein n=1 Tax=Bacillus kwashiorkori TaxID=1522318 RepID=UPI0007814C33|nr:hypothetical protein [Bacillus kwashiorkori]